MIKYFIIEHIKMYYKLKGRIKKLPEFYKMYVKFCKVLDEIIDKNFE